MSKLMGLRVTPLLSKPQNYWSSGRKSAELLINYDHRYNDDNFNNYINYYNNVNDNYYEKDNYYDKVNNN